MKPTMVIHPPRHHTPIHSTPQLLLNDTPDMYYMYYMYHMYHMYLPHVCTGNTNINVYMLYVLTHSSHGGIPLC